MRFILSLILYSSFIPSGPALLGHAQKRVNKFEKESIAATPRCFSNLDGLFHILNRSKGYLISNTCYILI